MKVIVVGGGRFGTSVIEKLLEENVKVILIDKDLSVCESIQEEYGIQTVNGDARDIDVLENAGIKEIDAIVIATPSEDTNLLIAVLAKQYKVPRIFIRISDDRYIRILRKLGFEDLIIPEELAAKFLVRKLFIKKGEDFIEFSGLLVYKIIVGKDDAKLIGEKVENINKKIKNFSIVAIKRGEKLIIGENLHLEIIKPGDELFLIGVGEASELISKIR